MVPELRFKISNIDWKITHLRSVFKSIESGVSVNAIDKPAIEAKEIGVLKTSCVSDGRFSPEENKIILPNELSRAKVNPLKDTIIISRMNTPQLVGELGLVENSYTNLFLPDRL